MKPDYKEIEAKIALLEVQLKLSEAAERAWESSMMRACGEDGPKSVADKFAELQAKCAELATELEVSGKLIDTLRQDKDKVIDMSIERVNKLLSRAEAAEKRIAEPVSVPDERAAFETFMEKRFKDCIDRRLVKNGDGEYFAWDMQVAWITWQGRAAMLQAEPVSNPYTLPANSFTDEELEGMAHGDNPQANAYRELLAYRAGEKK